MRIILPILLILLPALAHATTWHSDATSTELRCEILEPTTAPASPKTPVPVIFYLENLAAPRIGTDRDESIIRDFRTAGYLVVVLDYAHHPQARVPFINRDLAALRSQLQKKTLLADRKLDGAHIFIIPSGHRLQRDVIFFRSPDRTLALDIIYPSHAAQPVGAVLEFSCDNAARMGNYSLDFCTDTILPAAAIEGFAVAMADHPVAAPYEGFDAMPDVARKIKAAVRTLRATAPSLGLNSRIVVAGFSRGSGMALMLATTMNHSEFDGFGEHVGADSSVQGAVVMSGRFTYLDLLDDDHMLPRYNQTWGPLSSHEATWRAHGALDYLTPAVERAAPSPLAHANSQSNALGSTRSTSDSNQKIRTTIPPFFLTINVSESPDALHQMEVLRRRLTDLRHSFTYHPETEPRGHRMPLAPAVLDPLFSYLHNQLSESADKTPTSP